MAFEVKRGCSEFAISILVLKSWIVILNLIQMERNEKIIDNKENKRRSVLESSILGLNIYDALVLKIG